MAGEPEFSHDPDLVFAAFLEMRLTGKLPSPDDVADKNLEWIQDVNVMSQFYSYMRDYNERPDFMR